MFGKMFAFRSTAQAVAAILAGALPFAAQAAGTGPQNDVVFATAEGPGCGPGTAGVSLRLAAEPRAETVKDAPFSGVGTTELVTTLADGNRIVRNNTMKYYRDSRGRTRTEYSLAAIGPFTPEQAQTVVTITDPVEGKRYVLHSAFKRADVFPLTLDAKAVGDAKAKSAAGVAAANASKGASTAPFVRGFTASPSAGVVAAQRIEAGGVVSSGPSVRIGTSMLPPRGAGPEPVGPPLVVMSSAAGLPPANAGFIMQYSQTIAVASQGCKPSAKPLPAPTSLGERIIEGLKVTGTRNEFTIEAGAVGNEQPIVVSSEQWFSPELGMVVASTHRDPMMGDTSYKLEQISRAEPDASLFAVPADYTQSEVPVGKFFFESVPPPKGAQEK